MQRMEEMILNEGQVLPGGILKVGSFLNQQIDTAFLREIGEEIARLYDGAGVTKILTIESSGIALAAAAGIMMKVPMVFAKKSRTSNVSGDVYSTTVHSFTHNTDNNVIVSSEYLSSDDCILLVDDFLAEGNALRGLIDLCNQAGAEVAGAVVAIEKRFQGGGDAIRAEGIRVEPLACISFMDDEHVEFCQL